MSREKETCGACQRRSIDRVREKERCKNNTVTEESRSRFYTGREIKIEVSSLSRTLLKIRYGNAIGATVYNKIDVTSPVRKFQNPIKKFFSSSASVPANALSANAAAHTADVVSIWGSFANRFWIPTLTKTSSSSSFFQICSSSKRLVVFFAAALCVAVIDLLVEVLFAETVVVVPTTREEEEESIRVVVFIVVLSCGGTINMCCCISREIKIYLFSPKKREIFLLFLLCSLGFIIS